MASPQAMEKKRSQQIAEIHTSIQELRQELAGTRELSTGNVNIEQIPDFSAMIDAQMKAVRDELCGKLDALTSILAAMKDKLEPAPPAKKSDKSGQ
jgi:archaellum component FlaC